MELETTLAIIGMISLVVIFITALDATIYINTDKHIPKPIIIIVVLITSVFIYYIFLI